MGMTRIVIEDGNRSWIQEVPEDLRRVSVGRALDNTVIIEDSSASREHCVVERNPDTDEHWLVDLESRNGTRLNGRFVNRALIRPGDRIEIGSTVITFAAEGEESAAALAEQLEARRGSSDALARDPLTGLSSFPAVVQEVRERLAQEDYGHLAVVKLDLDYLGLLNDMFGMRAGDEIIRHVAAGIRTAVADLPGADARAGREGGGKFLVALLAGTAGQARELAELVRARIAERPLEGALREASITLSGGAAQAPEDGAAWDLLFLRAEAALAEAKRSGRDRVALAHPLQADRVPAVSVQDTRTSGLWAASGIWDPRVARGGLQKDDGAPQAIAPLILTHAGQSILGLVAQALGSDLDLESLFDLSLQMIMEAAGAERGYLMLRDPGGQMRLRRALDRQAAGRPTTTHPSQRIVREVLETRSATLVDDALADDRYKGSESIAALKLRSVLAAPILWGKEVVGLIALTNSSVAGRFGQEERDLLLAFGRLIAGPIRRQLLHQARHEELERARAALARTAESESRRRQRYANIIGESAAMKKLFRLLDRLSESNHPVLIHGESGTGKELVATAIHYNGPRREKPFIAENCAAFSGTLLESELFGHIKGAFTGADRDRVGLIEAADGGTLFLDEIGEMSPSMQAKLLRVLQEGEVRPVGGRDVRKVDVRLIAASNRNLGEMVKDGTFREDLYYRVAVMTIDVPPLRERREDIPQLVEHFLEKGAEKDGLPRPPELTRDALQLLVHYDWPGNVRELENEVKKLITLSPEHIGTDHLSPHFLAGASPDRPQSAIRRVAVSDGTDALLLMIERGKTIAEVVEAFEIEAITRLLQATGGNRSETARRLGLSRPGLLKKMKRYGVE